MTRHVALLVALSPALASLVLCVVANWSGFRSCYAAKVTAPLRSALKSRAHVSNLTNAALSFALGGLVAVVYGPQDAQLWDYVLAMALFIVFGVVTILLSKTAAELERAQDAEQRAQNAAVLKALESIRDRTRPTVARRQMRF